MAVFQKDLLEFVQLYGEDVIPFVVPLFQPPVTHLIEYVTAGKDGGFTGEVAEFRAAVRADLEDLWTDEEIRLPRRLIPESGWIGPIRCAVDECADSVGERGESGVSALPSLFELHSCRQFIDDLADLFDEKVEAQQDSLVFSRLPGHLLCGTQFAGDGDVTEEWRVLFPYYSLLSRLVEWGAVNREMWEYVLGRSPVAFNPHISVSLHKIVATAIKYASAIVAKDSSGWTRESLRDKMRESCASFLAGKVGVILLPKRDMPKDGLMFRLRCEIDSDASESESEDERVEPQSVECVKESEEEPLPAKMPATFCPNTHEQPCVSSLEAGDNSQQPSFSVSFPGGFYLNAPDEKPFVAVSSVDVERDDGSSSDSDIVWETDDKWREIEPQKLVVEIESDKEKEAEEEEAEETQVSITIGPREEEEREEEEEEEETPREKREEVVHLQEYVELGSDDEEKGGEDDGDVIVLSDTEWVEETRKGKRKEKRSRSRSGSAERIEARRLVSVFCAAWGADLERDGTRIAGIPSRLVSAKKGRSSPVELLARLRSTSLLPTGDWTDARVKILRPVMQHLFKQYRLADASSERDRLAAELRSFGTVYWTHPTNDVSVIEPPAALRGRPLEKVNMEETCRHLLSEVAIEAGSALIREKLASRLRVRLRALPPEVCGVVWEHDKHNGKVDGPCALLAHQMSSLRLLPPLSEVLLLSRGSLAPHLYAPLVAAAGAVLRSACSTAFEQECRYLRVARGEDSRALQHEMRDTAAAMWHNTPIVVQSNVQLKNSLSVMIVDTRGRCVWDAPPLPSIRTRKDGEGDRKSVQEEMDARRREKRSRKRKERQQRSADDWAERMKRHRDLRSRDRSRSSSKERGRNRSRSRDRRSRDRRSRSGDRNRSNVRNREKRSRSRGDRDWSQRRSRDRSASPKRSRTGEVSQLGHL